MDDSSGRKHLWANGGQKSQCHFVSWFLSKRSVFLCSYLFVGRLVNDDLQRGEGGSVCDLKKKWEESTSVREKEK